MATIVDPQARAAEPEERFVLPGIDWAGYEAILKIVGDRPVRVTYDRGNLEFMMPSRDHELFKRLLGRMIDTLTEELGIACIGAGSTTWRREDLARGLEPDECFYLANTGRILGKKEIHLGIDPPPDLAIEVEISRSALDRMGIYAALQIPEVWRFDGETLRVGQLQDDGTYAPREWSPSLPFLPLAEVVRFLREAEGADHSRWGRSFRAWVRDELAPHVRRGEGEGDGV